LEHRDRLEVAGFDEYRKMHQSRILRFEIPVVVHRPSLSISVLGISKSHSALPSLLKNEINVRESLVLSFFQHSGFCLNSSLFLELLDICSEAKTITAALEYSNRTSIQIPIDRMIELTEFDNHQLNSLVAARLPGDPSLVERVHSDRHFFSLVLSLDQYLENL
jgi:hypothetical protein